MGDERKDGLESLTTVASALETNLPKIAQIIRQQYGPQAASELEIAKKYSPEYLKLQADLMSGEDYGRLSEAGRKDSDKEQKAAAKTELDIAQTTGREMVGEADAAQRKLDPEFYKTIAQVSDMIGRTLGAVDPTKLTAGEQEQIARGLNRTAWAGGVGTPQETIKNAMTFGDALTRRRAEAMGLATAAGSVAPAMRSGISGIDVATRRTMMPNVATGNYTGIQMPGTQAMNALGANTLSSATAMQQQFQSQAKTWMDKFRGVTGGIGDILGGAGGGAGIMKMAGCWVARAAYGEQDVRWLMFRYWLHTDAPSWLLNAYYKYGPRFAEVVKRSKGLQKVLRFVMNFAVRKVQNKLGK